MKVPLILDTLVYSGEQYLKIWYNGKYELIKSPIYPFCYTENVPPMEAKVEKVKKRLLYDINNEKELYKCSFRTTYDMKECCNKNDFYEYEFKFKDRIYTCCPDLVNKFANTDDLKILCLDFEMSTEGSFPTSQDNAIIAAGIQRGDNPIELILADSYDNDYNLLIKLKRIVEEYDPDIFVTYNGTFFDIPYWIDRCKINNIDPSFISRDGSQPFITKNYIKLGGRIHYDLFTRSVLKDQKLFDKAEKVKDRKMKTVCKVYELDNVVEEPEEILGNMKDMVGTEELKTYLTSDIRCTRFLCDMYLLGIINLAEINNTSLESCINSSPSYIGNMLHATHYEKVGIVSDKSVGDAYPWLVHNKQGGLSCTFKPGLYKENLKKKDVQSDYPNLVRTLNLSPETCHFIGFEEELKPYTAHMNHEKQYLTLSVPDERANLQLIIGIDFSKRGFASSFVDKAMNDRLEMKRKMKLLNPHSAEYADLDVNQLQLKVIMNSITGYYGQDYSMFGSLACYCAITGTARHLIRSLIDYLGGVISLDTDGVITNDTTSIEDANKWLENFIYSTFEVPKNYMVLEEDEIYAGYFRPDENKKEDDEIQGKAKNYLLAEKDKNGEIHLIIHGASFKSSTLPQLYSNIIEDIGFKMLTYDLNDNKQLQSLKQDIAKYYDQRNWNLNLLKMNRNCRPLTEYKNPSDLGAQLTFQYENRFNYKIKNTTKLNFVKIKSIKDKYKKRMNEKDVMEKASSYKLITIFDNINDVKNIDMEYYKKIVDSALKRLNLYHLVPKTKQAGLFDF